MSDAMKRLQARQSGNSVQKYNPLDALLPSPVVTSEETVVYLPAEKLIDFSGHTFRMRSEEDSYMLSLRESIQENGILTPLLVRPHRNLTGSYEIIAGHTRKTVGIRIGLTEFPCIVKRLSDEDAILQMGETNVQRPDWLPSEKVRTYKLHLDALKQKYENRIGRPRAGNSEKWELSSHFSEDANRLRDLAAQRWGISGRAFDLYLKLNDLDDGLLRMVDEESISLKAAYQLSFLSLSAQQQLLMLLHENPKCSISEAEARDIRIHAEQSEIWSKILGLDGEKEKKPRFWKLNVLAGAFPSTAKKYLADPELQALLAETVRNYAKMQESKT